MDTFEEERRQMKRDIDDRLDAIEKRIMDNARNISNNNLAIMTNTNKLDNVGGIIYSTKLEEL